MQFSLSCPTPHQAGRNLPVDVHPLAELARGGIVGFHLKVGHVLADSQGNLFAHIKWVGGCAFGSMTGSCKLVAFSVRGAIG
jgi:hypothetical protein